MLELPIEQAKFSDVLITLATVLAGEFRQSQGKLRFDSADRIEMLWFDSAGKPAGAENVDEVIVSRDNLVMIGQAGHCLWIDYHVADN
jgi:hypothetical protein